MGLHDEVNQAITPTVGQIFKETVEKFPMHPALKHKEDETWKTITYTEYYNLCIKAAKSFLKVRVGVPYSGTLIWQGKHSQKITQNMFVLTYKYVHVTVLTCLSGRVRLLIRVYNPLYPIIYRAVSHNRNGSICNSWCTCIPD